MHPNKRFFKLLPVDVGKEWYRFGLGDEQMFKIDEVRTGVNISNDW